MDYNPQGEDAVEKEFEILRCALSPENLTCDGELSKTRVNQKLKDIKRQWKALEKKYSVKKDMYEF